MVNFIIPGFYENYNINTQLLTLLQEQPQWFYPDVAVSCVYGTFPFWIWDGGRVFDTYKHATFEEIEKIIDIYNNKFKIPLRLICTNPVVKEENYYNRFANLCLSLCHNGFNEITINNQGLENYIRENYPNYKFISSTTKCITSNEQLIEELNNPNYFMVCLDYNLNHNKKLLESLDQDTKDKCEFLCNAICPPNCPNRKQHYNLNGYFSLNYGRKYSTPGCGITAPTFAKETREYRNNITREELYNYYVKNNFSYFKIEGRTLPTLEVILNYVYYMVKPEYSDQVISLLTDYTFDFKDKMYYQHIL